MLMRLLKLGTPCSLQGLRAITGVDHSTQGKVNLFKLPDISGKLFQFL